MNNPSTVSKPVGGDALTTLIMGLAAGSLLGGYEFVRSTANTLFKQSFGKEGLPLVMAAVPVFLLVCLFLYGRLLSRVGPRRALVVTSLVSCLGLGVAYLGIGAGYSWCAVFLFLLRDSYIVLVLEQYWSFMVSVLKADSARTWNGIFCGIASLGSILGDYGCAMLSVPWGARAMLLCGIACTFPAILLADLAYWRVGEEAAGVTEARETTDDIGFSLFHTHRRLFFLLVVIMCTQVVGGVFDLAFQRFLHDEIPDPDRQNAFSGWFFGWLNAASAFGQFVLCPLLLRVLSMRILHGLIPLVHVAACGWFLSSPSLLSAGVAFFLFKSVDYSVFRAAKEILYIPFSFDVRYRAKEFIDVLGYRLGKGGVSLLIAVLPRVGVIVGDRFLGTLALTGLSAWWLCVGGVLEGGAGQPEKSQEDSGSSTVAKN